VATGPIVVHYFNQFSLAGIISNIFVVPFAGMIVVPLGLFSGILSLFLGYLPLAGLNQVAADWFVKTVTFFSRMPIAEFRLPSPAWWLRCCARHLIVLSVRPAAVPLQAAQYSSHAETLVKSPCHSVVDHFCCFGSFLQTEHRCRFSRYIRDCTLIQLRGGRTS
jgi:predicted membrane metal-binding protein